MLEIKIARQLRACGVSARARTHCTLHTAYLRVMTEVAQPVRLRRAVGDDTLRLLVVIVVIAAVVKVVAVIVDARDSYAYVLRDTWILTHACIRAAAAAAGLSSETTF